MNRSAMSLCYTYSDISYWHIPCLSENFPNKPVLMKRGDSAYTLALFTAYNHPILQFRFFILQLYEKPKIGYLEDMHMNNSLIK